MGQLQKTKKDTESLQNDGLGNFAAGAPTLGAANFNAIPEPSTFAFLVIALSALGLTRRRK